MKGEYTTQGKSKVLGEILPSPPQAELPTNTRTPYIHAIIPRQAWIRIPEFWTSEKGNGKEQMKQNRTEK
jgi:hypothetical protein